MQNKDSNYVKLLGQRILSEANDLKRTIPALAKVNTLTVEKIDRKMKAQKPLTSTLENM